MTTAPIELVTAYIATAQRARETLADKDFRRLRHFLADDVTIRMAAPWGDDPWRTVLTSADDLLTRLAAPINQATSLTTENLNIVMAGDDVLVEQLSTITREGREHRSVVCHIFSVESDRITSIRAYRNDDGLPAG